MHESPEGSVDGIFGARIVRFEYRAIHAIVAIVVSR